MTQLPSAPPVTVPELELPDPPGRLRRFGAAVSRRFCPEQRTRRTMSLMSGFVVVGLGGALGVRLQSGEGMLVDVGIGAGLTLALVLLLPLLFLGLAALTRGLPRFFGYFGFGAFLALAWVLDQSGFSTERAFGVAAGLILVNAMVFGSIAILTSGRFGEQGFFKKSWVIGCGGGGVAALVASIVYLTNSGSDEHVLATPKLAAAREPAPLAESDPSQPGPLTYRVLTYGSGDDRHREGFGAGAELKTEPVNGKPFAKWASGWRGDMRERFWGFDVGRLPLNGTVWLPAGDGPFPLVLCVHGNHHMAEFSDPGYAYLGEHLASRGTIFVSVDENFLNSGSPLQGGMNNENDARAWVLLEHLRVWRDWNGTEGNPFQGKVDLENIGLIGHSRGGEAVCHAAVFNRLTRYPDDASVEFDYGFGLKAICSIAPIDGQYRPAGRDVGMRDVSYFVIHGGHDGDVSSFYGDRHYRRLEFTEPQSDWFKASLWIYQANHGQFNTVWGDTDRSPPSSLFLNRAPLMAGEDQRQIAKAYIAAFIETTLHGKTGYRRLLESHRAGREWLPADALMVSRFEAPGFSVVTDFEEDVDVTTTSIVGGAISATDLVVWREAQIPLRSGARRLDNGVFVGWNTEPEDDAAQTPENGEPNPPPSYVIELPTTLPANFAPSVDRSLVLHLAESDDDPEAADYAVEESDEESEEEDEETDSEDEAEENAEEDRPPLDFSIELVTDDGTTSRLPLSEFGVLLPPLEVLLGRDPTGGAEPTVEPVLQRFALPLAAFVEAESAFDPARIRRIRLVFDRTPKGVVILDRVGFAPTGE